MREDHEEVILRNPAFGAGAFWHLARSFSDHAEGRTGHEDLVAEARGSSARCPSSESVRRATLASETLCDRALTDTFPRFILGQPVAAGVAAPPGWG
jgi:hypothetical protein